MKDYIDYMDNITPDPALKAKILKKAKSKPQANSRTFLGYAGLVATAAVLLLGMWVMPGAIRNLRGPDAQVIDIVSQNNEIAQIMPNAPAEIVPITPTDGSAMAGGAPHARHMLEIDPERGIVIPERDLSLPHSYGVTPPPLLNSTSWMTFAHQLTYDQFMQVFTSLGTDFTATAIYSYNGQLLEVSALRLLANGQSIHITLNICEATHNATIDRMTHTPDSDVQVTYMHGVPVTTHYATAGLTFYMAAFMLDNIGYTITIAGDPYGGQAQLTEISSILIANGTAGLSALANPEIPELRNDHLTIEEAQADPKYGPFLPTSIPSNMTLNIANRWICQNGNFLLLSWDGPSHASLRWMITTTQSHHQDGITTSQLPLITPEGEPTRAQRVFSIPSVTIEDITPELLESIGLWIEGNNNTPGHHIFSFTVIYGDVVIEISSSMLTAEQLIDMLPMIG